ncbi:MAG: ParB/RepB/Spo0J family partition protein [Verrucomicrobia bacterium]|nr:ParB/RepB/Spo0J family partition protein [Verrucomicrobiota bacterium]
MTKAVLGKGLGALIPATKNSAPILDSGERVERILLSEIVPSPLQPRKQFGPEQLQELVDSIREHGIIQPLIVRKVNGRFELIAGERRWRAASQLGLKEAPAIVREASDRDVLELALIENLQREDLNPIEEAHAYQRLVDDFSMRQEDIAHRVCKSRSVIANALRLLDLHPQVQSYLSQGRLAVGHAKVLLALSNIDEQLLAAELAIRQAASVRMTEKIVAAHLAQQGLSRSGKTGARPSTANANSVHNAVNHIENRLRERLATNVTISHHEKKGRIEIEYYGNDDLDRILAILGISAQ